MKYEKKHTTKQDEENVIISEIYNNCNEINEEENHFDNGINNIDLEYYDNAIEDFNKVIELNPKNADAYLNRGYAKLKNGNYKDVIEDFSEAIKQYSKLKFKNRISKSYLNRGLAQIELKNYKGAIEDFNQVIKLKPKNVDAYLNRGYAKLKNGNYKAAIKDFNKVIEINPKDQDAYNHRGYAKLNDQKYLEAIQDFEKAIQLKTTNPEIYNNLGCAQIHNNDRESAIENFTKAIKLRPNYIQAYLNRGYAQVDNTLNINQHSINDFKKAFEHTKYNIPDQIFYRFRPYNQYTLETLILDTFFVANPENFNDPFDTLLLRSGEANLEIPKSLQSFNESIRIACLGSIRENLNCPLENILLWSYYAQEHKGIAIGYKVTLTESFNERAFLKDVKYCESFKNTDYDNIFEEAYLNKSKKWQHEQEWRLVYLKNENEKDPILLNSKEFGIEIVEIIFGWKCDTSKRRAITEIFTQKPRYQNSKPSFFEMKRGKENDAFSLKKFKLKI